MLGKKGQARMPSSFGGLVQYYSEYKSKITIKPYVVIVLGVALITVVLVASTVFG
jgi:preprotein translocase subunit Sec61beta